MKKLKFVFLAIIIFLLCWGISCSNEENNNGIPPEVSDIRFNQNMKIAVLIDPINNLYDTIYLNPKGKSFDLLDTLVIGQPINVSGHFQSDNGLSNMKIRIWGDTLNISESDTCLNITEIPTSYLFNQKDTTLSNLIIYQELPATLNSAMSGKDKKVRQGEEYKFSIFCIDRFGNINNTSYNGKPIVILSLDSIVKLRY